MKLDGGISVQSEVGWDRPTFSTVRYLADNQKQPFLIYCERALFKQIRFWENTLPRVTPSHDVSLNSLAIILKSLHRKGVNLEVSCKQQLEAVAKIDNIDTKDGTIMMSAPHKVGSHIRAAEAAGVQYMAFNSSQEIRKISKNAPNARLFYHLECRETPNLVEVKDLLKSAMDAGLEVVGLYLDLQAPPTLNSPTTTATWYNWLRIARSIMDLAAGQLDLTLHQLHLGNMSTFMADCQASGSSAQRLCFHRNGEESHMTVAEMLDSLFPKSVKLTANGGRFLVSPAVTLAVRVIDVREKDAVTGDNVDMNYEYYINEGVFGAFSSCLWEENNDVVDGIDGSGDAGPAPPMLAQPLPLDGIKQQRNGGAVYVSSIFGPSGDSLDLIFDDLLLPQLAKDDWLLFPGLGVFTAAAFNDNYCQLNNHTTTYIVGRKPESSAPLEGNNLASPITFCNDSGDDNTCQIDLDQVQSMQLHAQVDDQATTNNETSNNGNNVNSDVGNSNETSGTTDGDDYESEKKASKKFFNQD